MAVIGMLSYLTMLKMDKSRRSLFGSVSATGKPLTVLFLNVGQLGKRGRATGSAWTMAANKEKALPTHSKKNSPNMVFNTIVCRQVARFVFLSTCRAAAPLSRGCSETSVGTGAAGPSH